ncbi:hypothetical protein GCM10011351_17670 [Paraliobacillus quinghaiensis]|uniref:Capsule polysaccharide biosynthesis protein n=1 Tax=Paraliobacillus quinghaiensis TaxID=470815 RepID=A0A917TQP2_9BACI|nr:hypothetical protein [Paraliobacillus quinghaiensis]GGM31949.1 hypothetical protein GCM10011351_17670 [Paraliobacillus quinghaiensis]
MEIDQFLKFETELCLFDDEISDIKYWHLIRKKIYDEIKRKKEDIDLAHRVSKNNSLISRGLKKIKQVPSVLTKSPVNLKEKDILVLNHHRRLKMGDYYECLYTDDLLTNLELTYYVIEDPMVDVHLKPAVTKNLKYTDVIHNKYVIRWMFHKLLNKKVISQVEREKIRNLVDKLNSFFDVDFENQYILTLVEKVIIKYRLFYTYYNNIIKKVNPKIIIEVVSYDFSRFVINNIAKKNGIPTIELQHGTMGKYHVAYNFAKEIKDISTFPDYIFLFGQFWKDQTRFPISDSKIKVVGWPFYEQKVNSYKNNKNERYRNKEVILFISQGHIGKHLSKIAVELSRKIDLKKYEMIYKLHPGEYARWREDYPWLVSSDMQIIDTNTYDMHYFFANADIQVGVSSTAVFEGIGYGLKTIVCKLPTHEYLEELFMNKLAYLVRDADELLQYIEAGLRPIFSDMNYFWNGKSIDNIKKNIKEIIDAKEKIQC